MLVGHLAVALAARSAEPRVSLGTFVLAAMLADFLLILFWLTGIERVEIVSGSGAAEYYRALDIGWSHSLVMSVGWALLAAGLVALGRQGRRAAIMIFIAVSSHWVLDAISHPPDMPIVPGGQARVGLGLWSSLPATLLVEGALWIVALGYYATRFPATSKLGLHGFWSVAALLTLVWYNNVAGAPPPDPDAAPMASLILFSMVVAWAYWIDGRRPRLATLP